MSLLITWRIRQVPASGAKVRPVRRAFWIWAAIPDGEGVDPQARQAHRHVAAADRVVHGGGDDVLDAGEVGGGQAGEGDLVVAGAAQALLDHRGDLVGRSLAHRAGDHPGLAEAAAAGAARGTPRR